MDKDKQIEELKAEIEKLKTLTNKDELTGILNRRGFKDEAGQFIGEVSEFKNYPERRRSMIIKNFSLVLFDIDDFKKVNDTHGHLVGDRVLQFFSQLILDRAREIDLVARWGGEEIIVGLPGANIDDAFNFAEDIRKSLENSVLEEVKFTVSGGVAGFHEAELGVGSRRGEGPNVVGTPQIGGNSVDFEQLFKNADTALYEAKNSGKNKIIKFKKEA